MSVLQRAVSGSVWRFRRRQQLAALATVSFSSGDVRPQFWTLVPQDHFEFLGPAPEKLVSATIIRPRNGALNRQVDLGFRAASVGSITSCGCKKSRRWPRRRPNTAFTLGKRRSGKPVISDSLACATERATAYEPVCWSLLLTWSNRKPSLAEASRYSSCKARRNSSTFGPTKS